MGATRRRIQSSHLHHFENTSSDPSGALGGLSLNEAHRLSCIPHGSLAVGMRRDQDAITNGLTLPHSSGAVEGAVTRAKAVKRAMYGRANLDLLRKRVLAQH